jgi:hypothetical protein
LVSGGSEDAHQANALAECVIGTILRECLDRADSDALRPFDKVDALSTSRVTDPVDDRFRSTGEKRLDCRGDPLAGVLDRDT